MGTIVNPIGWRLNTIRHWNYYFWSQKYNYSFLTHKCNNLLYILELYLRFRLSRYLQKFIKDEYLSLKLTNLRFLQKADKLIFLFFFKSKLFKTLKFKLNKSNSIYLWNDITFFTVYTNIFFSTRKNFNFKYYREKGIFNTKLLVYNKNKRIRRKKNIKFFNTFNFPLNFKRLFSSRFDRRNYKRKKKLKSFYLNIPRYLFNLYLSGEYDSLQREIVLKKKRKKFKKLELKKLAHCYKYKFSPKKVFSICTNKKYYFLLTYNLKNKINNFNKLKFKLNIYTTRRDRLKKLKDNIFFFSNFFKKLIFFFHVLPFFLFLKKLLIFKIKKYFKNSLKTKPVIFIIIKSPMKFIARFFIHWFIEQIISKKKRFRRSLLQLLRVLNYICDFKFILGYKIEIVGRISKKDRALYIWKRNLKISLPSKFSKVDYFSQTFFTKFSACKIKIWLLQ